MSDTAAFYAIAIPTSLIAGAALAALSFFFF